MAAQSCPETTLRHSTLLALILLCLLLAPLLRAESTVENCKRIFYDPALAAADYDAHLGVLLEVIREYPAEPEALLALTRAENLSGRVATLRPLYELLRGHVESNFAAFEHEAWKFADAYVDLARLYASDLDWQNVARRWRGITEAHWIGPFTTGFDSAHDDVFSPEVMLDFAGEYRGAYGNVRWQPLRVDDELGASLDLWAQSRWGGAGYYVSTVLLAEQDKLVNLTIATHFGLKVWLNGAPLLDADSRRGELGEIMLMLSLKQGANTLLIKCGSQSSLRLKLLDLGGQPATGVLARAPLPTDRRVPIRQGAATIVMPPSERPGVENLLGAGFEDEMTAALALFIHDVALSENLRWIAGEAIETASELAPENPYIQLMLAQTVDRNPLYSSSEARRARQRITAALMESGEGMAAASIERARLLKEEQRFEDAVQVLKHARKAHGDSWYLSLQLAEVYRDADWRIEEYRELRHALELMPKAEPVLRARARYYGSYSLLDRRIEAERLALESRPGDRDAHHALITTLLRTGNAQPALSHARQLVASHPGNSHMLGILAEVQGANGQIDDALKTFERIAQMTPRPEDVWEDAATLCLQNGMDERAALYLRRALEASPGKHFARRQLQRIQDAPEDFWTEFELGIQPGLDLGITAEDFPHASSALVVDEMVQWIFEDGSHVSFVRQVRKILTQDGVDQWGRERARGELISARTIRPDGTVLEPITQASGLIEYPGVEVGSYLEIAFVARSEGNAYGTLDGDRWFFADPELHEPYCISRWVMIAPKSMPFHFKYFNLSFDKEGDDETQGFHFSEHDKGDNVVRIWDVRAPYLPEYQPFMPPTLELIPWMECVVAHDWRERARRLAIEGLADTRVTMRIRNTALEITQGHESDIDKARAIYEWVNTTFVTRGDTHNAHQALKSGTGDRRRVFIALCHAADIDLGFAFADAAPPFKSAEPERLARPRWMYSRDEDFDVFLLVVWKGETPVYIDLHDRLRPFGLLSTRLHHAPVMIWRGGEYLLTQIPGGDPEADRFEHHAHIRLNADGSAAITGRHVLVGERSYSTKEMMRTMPADRMRLMLESDVANHFPGFDLGEARFPRLDEVGEGLTQEFEGRAPSLASAGDNELVLEFPGEKLGRLLSALVGSETRDFDLVLSFNLVQHDTVRITPPEGYSFADLPRDLLFPTAPLSFSMQFRMDGRDLVMTRRLVLGPGRFTPADYVDLVEQIKRIQDAESVQIRLHADD